MTEWFKVLIGGNPRSIKSTNQKGLIRDQVIICILFRRKPCNELSLTIVSSTLQIYKTRANVIFDDSEFSVRRSTVGNRFEIGRELYEQHCSMENVAASQLLPAGNLRMSYLRAVSVLAVVSTLLCLSTTTAAATQARKCSMHEVELYLKNANGTEKFYQCQPCPICPFGQGGSVACGERYPNGTRIECLSCVEGKNYSDEHDRGMCKTCTDCGNKRVLRDCSLHEKRICSDECKPGFHHKSITDKCEECAPCCVRGFAKQNSYPPECRDMPNDEKCEKTHFTALCPHMKVQSTASLPITTPPTTTLKTTLTPKPHTPQTTAPPLISEAEKEQKENDGRASKEDSPAKSPWAIGLYAVAGLIPLAVIAYIWRSRRNGIISNNSSISSIPDEVDQSRGERKENVKFEMEPLSSLKRTESPLTHQSGGKRKMPKCFKTKQVTPSKEVNAKYNYSELPTTDQPQTNNQDHPPLDKGQPLLVPPTEDELKSMINRIPDGHLLSNLPGELVNYVSMKLDTPSSLNGWYRMGLALSIDKEILDYLKIENMREGGSPTREVLGNVNAKFPAALTETFVEALHTVNRFDIARKICNWEWNQVGR